MDASSSPVMMPRIGMEVVAVMARDQFIALAAPSFCPPSPGRRPADDRRAAPAVVLPPDVVAEIGRRWVLSVSRHLGFTLKLQLLAGLVSPAGESVGDRVGGRAPETGDVHVFAGVSPTMGVVRWRMCATDKLTVGRLAIRGCLGPDRFLCWHMILDRYGPSIDRSLIRKHLMPLVSRSPHVATHIISSFGLTIDEFREYVTAQSRHTFEVSVKLWLGMPLS
ncbi:hypothetical protein Pelo_7871 [Pelomyxa schiedti]|nr:hypothetical protein Pelo_7871 [Pelomyxa schiedti]